MNDRTLAIEIEDRLVEFEANLNALARRVLEQHGALIEVAAAIAAGDFPNASDELVASARALTTSLTAERVTEFVKVTASPCP